MKWSKGQPWPILVKGPITHLDLVRYADASGDYNPIHTVESFAKQMGLDGVIAHGMLTTAYVGQMLTDVVWPEGDLVDLTIRFRAMVRPGDMITCKGVVTGIHETATGDQISVSVLAENQHGETVVKGTAILHRVN